MPNKTFTVRVSQDAPDITSNNVAEWLAAYLAAPAELGPDPGAGGRSLRLSLDRKHVERGADAASEPEAVFLRRLIATHVRVPQEEKEVEEREERPEARLRAPVLRGTLKLRSEQIRPVIHLVEAGQSYVLRQAFRLPPHPAVFQAAAYTEEERDQLSAASCEVLNRRAPRALVENIDLVGLVTTLVAIESRKIEAVQAVAENFHKLRQEARPVTQPRAEAQPARVPTEQSQPPGGQP